MGSEESHLQETVPQELLDADRTLSIVVVEGNEIIYSSEIETTIESPFTLDVSRFLPNIIPLTLPIFFETTAQILQDAQTRQGITSANFIGFTEEYPPDKFGDNEDELICYRLLKREPAKMSADGTSRPQRGFTSYYDLAQAKDPNKIMIIESRPIDHRIEFTCWAKSNKLANARALWLENLLTNHSWAYSIKGAERFWWTDRGPDTYTTSGGQRLFYRPLNFFLRFREFAVRAAPTIQHIEIQYGLQNYLINTSTYED